MEGTDLLSDAEQKRYESFMSGWVQKFQQSFLLQEAGSMNPGLWDNQLQSMKWVFSNRAAIIYGEKLKAAHVP